MQDAGLYALYKLHLIDAALHEIKSHAGSLDVGMEEATRYKEIEANSAPERTRVQQIKRDIADAELEQKTLADKVAKYEKQLFDGSLTNSREVENVQKEIAMLKALSEELDGKLLDLYDRAPGLEKQTATVEAELQALAKTIRAKQEAAKAEHERLQAAYQSKGSERAAALAKVEPAMKATYEAIRAKTGSTAMALVTKDDRCAHCGMHVPEKASDAIRTGRVTQCEQCRRILFILMPSV